MAFDDIPRALHQETLDWLFENGIKHVSSHCVNYTNAQEIAETLGVNEVHGSQIVKLENYEF